MSGGVSGLRILLTESSSTSAREAITALALAGHTVSYCDPARLCLGRFSRLVAHRFVCPPLGADPHGYLAFTRSLLATGRFDVLLPIHEQGYLFARVPQAVAPHAALALPNFDAYARVHIKSGFYSLLRTLDLGHPSTTVIHNGDEITQKDDYPYVLKIDIGTASRGTWLVRNSAERARAWREILNNNLPGEPILAQDWVDAPLEQAQSVFRHGRLVGFHATRRLIEGAGGGAALKESVARPNVAEDLARIGAHLTWHGALSVDYFACEDGARPLYIDGNPRLVEPMAATLAGLNLADLLVRVSLGETVGACAFGQPGIRTRLALQAVLASARAGLRRAVLGTLRDAITGRGAYAGATEELNPAWLDAPSLIPVLGAAASLLANPANAERLARRGWGAHLLTPEAARAIRAM